MPATAVLGQRVLAEAKTFTLTGIPALLVILAILAVLIGIGVLIGRRMKRKK